MSVIQPEHQKLIDHAISTGAYVNANQVIGRALEMLADEDNWLRMNRDSIHEKISQGLAQLDRGEGIPGEEVYRNLQERKAEYLARHHRLT